MPMNARVDRPSGPELYSEVRSYCVRMRCSQADFARASGITEQTLRSIELAERPLERTVSRVRGFIDANTCKRPASVGVTPIRAGRGPGLVTQRDGATSLDKARAASIAPARPSPAAIAAAEAEDAARRRGDARTGSPRRPVAHVLPRDAAPAEVLATALVETPGDLVGRVRAAWPDLWSGVVQAARASGVPAGAMLMTVIRMGLDEIGFEEMSA